MDLTIALIAISLAVDAFSVSISHGLVNKTFKMANAVKLGISFGSFQTLMPVLGWLAGVSILNFISGFDHWIAFGLLCFIGFRMIYESTKNDSEKLFNSLSIGILFVLSVATSIDALSVGLSLSFLRIQVLEPAIMAGVVTFCLSFLGVYFGNQFGHFVGKKAEVTGGLILIIIGFRILFEHIMV